METLSNETSLTQAVELESTPPERLASTLNVVAPAVGKLATSAERDFWEDGVEPDWFYFTD